MVFLTSAKVQGLRHLVTFLYTGRVGDCDRRELKELARFLGFTTGQIFQHTIVEQGDGEKRVVESKNAVADMDDTSKNQAVAATEEQSSECVKKSNRTVRKRKAAIEVTFGFEHIDAEKRGRSYFDEAIKYGTERKTFEVTGEIHKKLKSSGAELKGDCMPSQDVSKYVCFQCGKVSHRKSIIEHHLPTHFRKEFSHLPAVKPYTCPTCDKEFKVRSRLIRHVAFTHDEIFLHCTQEQLSCKDTNKDLNFEYVCSKCGKISSSRNGLKSHMVTHCRPEIESALLFSPVQSLRLDDVPEGEEEEEVVGSNVKREKIGGWIDYCEEEI